MYLGIKTRIIYRRITDEQVSPLLYDLERIPERMVFVHASVAT